MRTQHDPTNNTIAIECLAQLVSILHVTDSHMALADERDPDALPHAEHYGALFRARTPDGCMRKCLLLGQGRTSYTHVAGAVTVTSEAETAPPMAAATLDLNSC